MSEAGIRPRSSGGDIAKSSPPPAGQAFREPLRDLGLYERLATPYFACRADQRFGYFLYVPARLTRANAAEFITVVMVHGTGRTAETYRDRMADFAEAHDCVIVAPLFAAGVEEPYELNNYKFLEYAGIRFDLLLLEMVGEVAEHYGVAADRFLLHGFSGGGHFAHRFFYLHPQRLAGVSIGAPGMVTLLDFDRDWHCGLRDAALRFGAPLDLAAMARVPVQMVAGEQDIEGHEIIVEPTSRLWMAGVNDAGATRVARLAALRDSFVAHGIAVRHELEPGVAHEGYRLLGRVQSFFRDVLQDLRGAPAPLRG